MKKYIILLLSNFLIASLGNSQNCNITVSPQDTTICNGDSILIMGSADFVPSSQSFNFDFGVNPPGWSTTGGATFSQPCGSGINNTPYYWASTSGTSTPALISPSIDVSCGGFLNFDMVYGIASSAAPCEGPDDEHEGVELQFSTDGGLNWTPIVYYSPGGFELPNNPGNPGTPISGATPYTSWNTFSVPIPLVAQSSGTNFQWIQTNSTGTCCDNWGIDNIEFIGGPCSISWSNGLSDTNSFWAGPSQDTSFFAMVYDMLGNVMCSSDTINITVNPEPFIDLGSDQTICNYSQTSLDAGPGMTNYLWNTGEETQIINIDGSILGDGMYDYYVTITNGNGCMSSDTISVIVDPCLGVGEEILGVEKKLVKIIDLLGRETPNKINTILIYIYSDGSKEKVFRMEE